MSRGRPAPEKTLDFGAPDTFDAYLFRVEIPAARTEPVWIVEDLARHVALVGGLSRDPRRVSLPRPIWTAIADIARQEFNARLRAARMPTGRWHSGANLLDRTFGKELCVLAWAVESATDEQIRIIGKRWRALRPEERWWLFNKSVEDAELPGDTKRGWRRAVFHALSDE